MCLFYPLCVLSLLLFLLYPATLQQGGPPYEPGVVQGFFLLEGSFSLTLLLLEFWAWVSA